MALNMKIFQMILMGLAQAPAIIQHVADTIHGSGASKKDKALELTTIGLGVLDQFAPQVRQDAEFQRLVGVANDAIYQAAKYGALLAAK